MAGQQDLSSVFRSIFVVIVSMETTILCLTLLLCKRCHLGAAHNMPKESTICKILVRDDLSGYIHPIYPGAHKIYSAGRVCWSGKLVSPISAVGLALHRMQVYSYYLLDGLPGGLACFEH